MHMLKPPKLGVPIKKHLPTNISNKTGAVGLRPVQMASNARKRAWAGLIKLKPSTKKQWIIGGIIAVFVLGGGIFGFMYLQNKVGKASRDGDHSINPPAKNPKPSTEPSRLTGVLVDPELNKRPVTAVMIENSVDARPQAGLKDAGVVFEAIAEGGITRFLALFQEAQPDHIGPVRSVRPYYLDWVAQFDAGIAHHGGSAEGLAKLRSLGLKDLESGGGYRRVSNRFAPHNLYTDSASLDAIANSKGYTSSTFTSWPRKKEQASPTPTAKSIDFNISRVLYNPHFDYDATTNSYKRSMNNQPHKDEKSGEQIAPKVVIGLVINRSQSGIYSVYQTVGGGPVLIFQDGLVTKGTWSKAGIRDQMIFKDAAGEPLRLNPGQTWISLITSEGAAAYSP